MNITLFVRFFARTYGQFGLLGKYLTAKLPNLRCSASSKFKKLFFQKSGLRIQKIPSLENRESSVRPKL
jgi:hypothetical protein